jgi:hypothetical protein
VFEFNEIWSRDCAAVLKSDPLRNFTLRQTEFPAPPFDDLSKVFHFTAISLVNTGILQFYNLLSKRMQALRDESD